MKSTYIDMMLQMSRRLSLCTLVLALGTTPVFAQSDDEDEAEEAELNIKQPKRKQTTLKYPTVNLHGQVIDLATKKPMAGVQLQALGYSRYTAMTEEDGTFTIKVPQFTTALYVHSPEYLPQQVAVVAGDSTQQLCIKMLSDQYQNMYGKGTTYTAMNQIEVERLGATVENEIANRMGADVHAIQHSGVEDFGTSMFIRGLNSINSNAQPLVVIDGVEQDMMRSRTNLHDGQFTNILANLSPQDIEKVTVLKNATALYGARGANGVILIDTKRGHSMATRIDANISAGVTLVPQLPTMMDAAQYRNYATEMLKTVPEAVTMRANAQTINLPFLNDNTNLTQNLDYPVYHNNTDWADEVYRTAITQNYGINVQGGDDIGMYNLSVGYMNAESTVKHSDFSRMNVRFNTDIKITWNLETKFDLSISRTENNVFDDGIQQDLSASAITSPTFLSLIKSPLVSPYTYSTIIDGQTAFYPGPVMIPGGFTSTLNSYDQLYSALDRTKYALANPVSILQNGDGDNKNKAENTVFNARLEPTLKLGNDFRLTETVSYTLDRKAQRYYRPSQGVPPFYVEGLGTVTTMVTSLFAKESNFLSNTRVDWAHQYGKHTLSAFGGFRYNYFSYDDSDLWTQYNTATSDKNPHLSTTPYPGVQGSNDVWKTLQWYANADYNYMNRYFLTLSLMAEANSRFGDNADGLKLFGTQWAIFPSVQAGWVITNEAWFPKHTGIDYLRVNAGFDISGNDDISNYAVRTSYSTVRFNNDLIGIQLTNVGNDQIQWESTKKLNVGLQAFLLDNRLGVSLNYFYHKTDNLLTYKTFSNPIGGINRYWSNGGELKNNGYELTITGKPVVTRDWHLELGASVGHYKNEVTKLPDGDFNSSIYGTENVRTMVGQPVGVFYGYKTNGVFASDKDAKKAGLGGNDYLYMKDAADVATPFQAGDVHFLDLNGDGLIDADNDRTVIGDPNPDIYGNIFATLNWKKLTLSLGFNYSLGNDVYNYQRSVLNSVSTLYNQQVASVGRWRYEGQQAELPKATYGDPMQNNRFSDRWIEDGSYLRLKTVRLNYQVPIPQSWTSWLQGLSVWGEAQNLLTLTRYTGNDPEFSIANGVMYQGIDCGNLAQSRSFTLGVQINL